MPTLLSYLYERDENMVAIAKRFVRALNIKVSDTTLEESLLTHPDFPSMLSLSECFSKWKIDNAALQLNKEALSELDAPFITSITNKDQVDFIIVRKVLGNKVTIEFEGGIKNLSFGEFYNQWSGSVFVAEKGEHSGEKDYARNKKSERLNLLRMPILLIVFVLMTGYLIQSWSVHYWQTVTFSLICIMGALVSILIIKIQNSGGNINICKLGDKSDCSLILNSTGSNVFGVSFSYIGITFFLANLIIILLSFGNITSPYLSILSLLSMFSLPYTLFSIYYQWRVAKAWCILCLSIQLMLWVNFIIIYPFIHSEIGISSIFNTFLMYLAIGSLLFVLSPLIKNSSEHKKWKFQYRQLKTSKELFLNSLRSELRISAYANKIEPLILGNPLAEHTITFITNPFCSPCSKIHKELEDVLKTSQEVKICIIFYACHEGAKQVVQHFLSLYNHDKNVKEAMGHWFRDTSKDYEALKIKFPSNDESKYADQVDSHCQWCIDSLIPHTPFLYIDGFTVPKFYDIAEIVSILSNLTLSEIDNHHDYTSKRKDIIIY